MGLEDISSPVFTIDSNKVSMPDIAGKTYTFDEVIDIIGW